MKVKTFGFRWKKPLPGELSIQRFFQYIAEGNHAIGDEYEIFLCQETVLGSRWWVGVVLRIRDSKNYTALKRSPQGKRILTAESMSDGRLVEPSFLIAHPRTGNGLFSAHHLSASLPTFSFITEVKFRGFKDFEMASALEDAESKAEERRIKNEFKGKLELIQFCHPKDFKALVNQFDKISRAEWTVSDLGSRHRLFHALSARAKSRKFILTYDDQWANLDGLSSEIAGTAAHDNVSEIKVTGRVKGEERDVFLHKDTKQVLGERDYDGIVNEMSLDLDDWRSSLAKSKVISWLVSLANDADVKFQIENE